MTADRHSSSSTEQLEATDAATPLCAVHSVHEDHVRAVRGAMPSDDLIEGVTDIFKVLANPTRVRILRALAQQDLCVCDLAQVLGLSISGVSHQLSMMRQRRLVRSRSEGKLAYYSLRDPFVSALLEDCLHHLDAGAPR